MTKLQRIYQIICTTNQIVVTNADGEVCKGLLIPSHNLDILVDLFTLADRVKILKQLNRKGYEQGTTITKDNLYKEIERISNKLDREEEV